MKTVRGASGQRLRATKDLVASGGEIIDGWRVVAEVDFAPACVLALRTEKEKKDGRPCSVTVAREDIFDALGAAVRPKRSSFAAAIPPILR